MGAGIGVAAGIATLVLPIAFLWLTLYNPGGFFTFGTQLVQAISILVLAGAIMFLLSFIVYRTGFAALRRVDPRFAAASVLCLIGSLGFLLLVIAAGVLLGSSSSLVACVHGAPRQLVSCLKSGEPLGAYTALAGFWLAWLGGVGMVLGLFFAGSRFHRGGVAGGAAIYAILLLVIVGPFLALLYPVPTFTELLLVVPVLALLAPALVFAGSYPSLRPSPDGR